MPPRHAYWTIILEGAPTAFRAHTAEELLPTLKQLQGKHPDAVLKWFARGKLWHSPEEAQLAARVKQEQSERRPQTWRPGGEHRDPRERFNIPRDEKRRRFAERLRRDQRDVPPSGSEAQRDRETQGPPREQREGFRPREEHQRPPREQREGFRPREERQRPPREQREGFKPREEHQRPPREQREGFKPRGDRPGGGSPDRRPSGSVRKWDQGDRGDNRRPREGGAPHGQGAKPARTGDRRPWSDRGGEGQRNKPSGFGPRGRGPGGENRGPGGRGPGGENRGPGGRGPGGGNRGPGGREFGNRGPRGRGPGGGNRGPGGRGPGGRGPGGGNRGGGPR